MSRPWMDDHLQSEARCCAFIKVTDGRPIEEALRGDQKGNPLLRPPFIIDGECDLHTDYRVADLEGWRHVEGTVLVECGAECDCAKEAERE